MEQSRSEELFEVEQRVITEHEVMLELQRAMLPVGLPVLPDLNLAAGYRLADFAESAGGDWFDVVPIPGDVVGLAVGDMVGHGATASAVMGQVRAVAAERLQRGSGLEEVLRALDAFAARSAAARGGTVCIAVLDRRTGAIRYTVRGHPPPLVVAADGTTRYLTGSAGVPLAMLSNGFRVAHDRLEPGDTLVLYSDGVIMRPRQTAGQGMAALAECVAQVVRRNRDGERYAAGAICAALTDGAQASPDDVSVLAATALSAAPEPLTISMPATVDQLGRVRKQLSGWLADFHAGEDDLVALELSVVEAVTNAIEHAYAGPPGSVRISARLERDGTVSAMVSDDGRWKPPEADPGFRGRGLIMMREFSDQFRLDISDGGTTVRLAKTLTRPVAVDGDPRSNIGLDADLRVQTRIQPDAVIVSLAGALDSSGLRRLHASLMDAERIESLPLIVVLDEVTLLASAGLRALYEHAVRLSAARRNLRLIAAPTSPARDVLEVSGLDGLVEVADRR